MSFLNEVTDACKKNSVIYDKINKTQTKTSRQSIYFITFLCYLETFMNRPKSICSYLEGKYCTSP